VTRGPLRGLHVLDLSTYVAGPSATMTMAQLGADVVRVDPPGGAADYHRLPFSPGGLSLYWAGLNKAKRSIQVDLRSDRGRELVRSLLGAPGPGHGILLTNAVGQDWLRYDRLREARPDLIQVCIVGQADGRPAVDYTVNCEVGLPWITGSPESAVPVNHVLPAWDLLTGLHAAIALLVAERARAATGQGQLIELSLADVASATMGHLGFVADAVINSNARERDGNYLYGSYGRDFATADGRRVMVVALTKRHWRNLVEVTGSAGTITSLEQALAADFGEEGTRYQFREVISAVLAPWFAVRPHAEVAAALDEGYVLWGDYRTVEEFVGSIRSALTSNSLFAEVEQSAAGIFPIPGPVARAEDWNDSRPQPAPSLGADAPDVLTEWLDITPAEIAALKRAGIIDWDDMQASPSSSSIAP
jgi:2-methylfumaryl-CoA isomerase